MEELKVAAYLRISVKDRNNRDESNSIRSQKLIVEKYVANASEFKGIVPTFYIDDGCSGTNFQRPQVQQLFEDIRNNKVNCIIVKDFSRFGRNYIEVGAYLGHIFQFQGVRFVSIGDFYDSAYKKLSDYILVSSKTIIGDVLSKDLSKKVTNSMKSYANSGKYVSSFVAFGYVKSSTQKNTIEIDPEAAEIVRYIFGKYLEGTPQVDIARELNVKKVLIPSEYKKSKGRYGQKSSGEIKAWTASSVRKILINDTYMGTYTFGKNKRVQVGSSKVKAVPKEEWIVVENAHEPIISPELFREAQSMKKVRPRGVSASPNTIVTLLRCGVCGRKMMLQSKNIRCKFSVASPELSCSHTKITLSQIETLLFQTLKTQIDLLVKEETLRELNPNVLQLDAMKLSLLQKKKEWEQWSERVKNLFEEYVSQKISRELYQEELQEYTQRQNKVCCEMVDLENQISLAHEQSKKDTSWKEAIHILKEKEDMTKEILQLMIKEVIITSNEEIEIVWNYT